MLLRSLFRSRAIAVCIRFPLVMIVVLLQSAARVSAAAAQNSAAQNLAAAAAAETTGNYAAAAAYYRQALAEMAAPSGQAAVRVQLAKDYFLLRQYEESLRVLKPALVEFARARSQTAARARLVAGIDELELNRLPAAMQDLQYALAADPESGTARLALGDAYARSARLDEAAREYREQLRRTPSVADAWYKLGIIYSKLSVTTVQDFEQHHPHDPLVGQLIAERSLDRDDSAAALHWLLPILRTDPGQPDVRADIGAALLNMGHAGAAAAQFHAELLHNPESPKALLGLAEADALEENWEAAFQAFVRVLRFHSRELREAMELPPAKPLRDSWQQRRLTIPARWADTPAGKLLSNWLNSNAGVDITRPTSDAACASGRLATRLAAPGVWLTDSCYRKLESQLETTHRLSITALSKLTETEFRLGNYEKARTDAARLAQLEPANGWAAYWLARSYTALAYMCFEKLSSTSPGSPRVQEILAQLDAEQFRWSRAEREYKSAIRLAPDLPDLYLGLGTVYWQAGDWTHAELELKRTLELDPASGVASYELGDCYVEQHQWPAAAPYLRRALASPEVSYRARLDLAQAEEATGDDRGAIEDLVPVADRDQDGILHYRLALLYRKLGDSARAEQALTRSQDLRRLSAKSAQREINHAEEDLQKLQPSSQSAQP